PDGEAGRGEENGMKDSEGGRQAKAADDPESHRLESQPPSRTGETPPYGMIGRVEETSASFEARSAPRSYPTPISGCERMQQKQFTRSPRRRGRAAPVAR